VTFHGISPAAAVVLALCAVAVLTAAHILHRRYQRALVPALRFWSAALKRHRQDTLGGRLRHPLTWLLLCSLAGLLILGMLQPAFSGSRGPRPLVVILDRRSTMALPCDTGSTRLARAQGLAKGFLDRAAGPAGVFLIAVDHTATVLSTDTDPKTEALHHLAGATGYEATGDLGMDQALALAETLVRCRPRTGVLMLTDHAQTGRDLPAGLRSRLTVLNVAESTDNLAAFAPQVQPLADGTVRLEVWVGHWGRAPCRATLTLLQDGQARAEQTLSLGPDAMQACVFQVGADEVPALSVRVARDAESPGQEAFTLDDRAQPPAWRRRLVFVPDDSPSPLQAAIAANPAYQRAAKPEDAEVCVALTVDEPTGTDTYGAVEITAALCPDAAVRQAWMADLFVGPHPRPVRVEGPATTLLATTDGQPLAVRSDTVPAKVTLSPSLFDDHATFWKQPQCLAVLDAALGPAAPPDSRAGSPDPARAAYSDLTLSETDLREARDLPAVNAPVPVARAILWAALVLALFELVCTCTGRIV